MPDVLPPVAGGRRTTRRTTRRTWPLWSALLLLVGGLVMLSTQDTRAPGELDGVAAPRIRALLGQWFVTPLQAAAASPASHTAASDECSGLRTVDYAFRPTGQLGFSVDCLGPDRRPVHLDGLVAWSSTMGARHRDGSTGEAWRHLLHGLYDRLQSLAGPIHEVVAVDDGAGFALVTVAGSGQPLLLSRQQRVDAVAAQRFLDRVRPSGHA